MTRLINLVVVVFALVVGLAIHLRNHQEVVVDYYVGAVEAPLSWIIVLALGIGFGLGLVAAGSVLVRQRARLRRLGRRNEAMQRELASVTARPVDNAS